jgi:putative chitinase
MIPVPTLQKLFPTCPHLRLVGLAPHLNAAMHEFDITTPAREAAFLAQIGHETSDLRHLQELWGPTEQQKKYEPPSPLATRLGNVMPGDGLRFRGRGAVQLTGRQNYQRASKFFNVDFESEPRKVASADYAFRVAGWYWQIKDLNALADAGDFAEITRRINGGTTGERDRNARFMAALDVLGGNHIG